MDNMEREDLRKEAYEDLKELPKVEDSYAAKTEASKFTINQESENSESDESDVKGRDEVEPIPELSEEADALISEEKLKEAESKEIIENDNKAESELKEPNEKDKKEDIKDKSYEDQEIPEETPQEAPRIGDTEVEFNIKYETNFGEKVVVIGSSEDLGAWNLESAFELQWTEGGVWTGKRKLKSLPVEYKYACVSEKNSRWEEGYNRILNSDLFLLNETWQTSN